MNVSDSVGVTFVNAVINRGILNGVINISFGTCNFTPDDNAEKVDFDMVVSARLRMDTVCARQLYETLGSLLQTIEQEAAVSPVPDDGGLSAAGKPN